MTDKIKQDAADFKAAVVLPKWWRYLGVNDTQFIANGWVYDAGGGVIVRLVYQYASERGALVEKIDGKYNCVVSNKTAAELNEFIGGHY